MVCYEGAWIGVLEVDGDFKGEWKGAVVRTLMARWAVYIPFLTPSLKTITVGRSTS